MEAASIPETPTAAPKRNPVAAWLSENILWVLLGLALVYYFVQDPKQTLDDVKTGLSNGTIWALIALGYTLVYGIIELINFAHGEVFMIGSFVSVSIWATLGVTDSSGIVVSMPDRNSVKILVRSWKSLARSRNDSVSRFRRSSSRWRASISRRSSVRPATARLRRSRNSLLAARSETFESASSVMRTMSVSVSPYVVSARRAARRSSPSMRAADPDRPRGTIRAGCDRERAPCSGGVTRSPLA